MRYLPVLPFALLTMPPAAQEAPTAPAPTVTAEQAIETAQEVYGPPDARPQRRCPPQKAGGEIVVCAEQEDQAQFRVRSSSDIDPTGAGARGGGPRPPDVGTTYPGVVVAKGCFIPPCPPPMPELIDLKAIPEAPPGSDADRVARGLAPRGRDDVPVAPVEPAATAPAARAPGEEDPITPPG